MSIDLKDKALLDRSDARVTHATGIGGAIRALINRVRSGDLGSFMSKTCASALRPDDLDEVAALAAKDKQMPREGIDLKGLLHQQRPTRKAAPLMWSTT